MILRKPKIARHRGDRPPPQKCIGQDRLMLPGDRLGDRLEEPFVPGFQVDSVSPQSWERPNAVEMLKGHPFGPP